MRVPEPDALPLQRTRTGLTVVITTSGFREGPGPDAAAAAIAEGVHAASPATRVLPIPVMDGGSFAEEVTRLWSGVIERVPVLDEDGRPMLARIGLAGPADERIAVIGVDDARDPRPASPDRRDPSRASSRGVGQLIRAALDRGARRMVIGCGDSGPNDGGVGMATELGIRFLDANRMEIVEAGGLQRLARVDMTHRDPRLDGIALEVVVNPGNALLGDGGTARRFAARSGAPPGQVRRLEIGLARYADVIRDLSGMDVTRLPGAGAGGGLAAGLAAFVGARLTPRLDFLRQGLRVDRHLAMADMAITAADGAADRDNVSEVPAWLAWRARMLGLPVFALAPPVGDDGAGGADRRGTTGSARSLRSEDAWQRTREWLRNASSRAMRAAIERVAPTTPVPSSRPRAT